MRLVDHHLVEADGRVHALNVGRLLPEKKLCYTGILKKIYMSLLPLDIREAERVSFGFPGSGGSGGRSLRIALARLLLVFLLERDN